MNEKLFKIIIIIGSLAILKMIIIILEENYHRNIHISKISKKQ